jgi:hypothetical protein
MKNLNPFELIIIIYPLNEIKHGRIIGIQRMNDNSITYTVEPLSVNLKPMNGNRVIKFNSKDVDKNEIKVETIKL